MQGSDHKRSESYVKKVVKKVQCGHTLPLIGAEFVLCTGGGGGVGGGGWGGGGGGGGVWVGCWDNSFSGESEKKGSRKPVLPEKIRKTRKGKLMGKVSSMT